MKKNLFTSRLSISSGDESGGFEIGAVIIVFVAVLFLVFPVFGVLVEKKMIDIIIMDICDAVEIAAFSLITQSDMDLLSSGSLMLSDELLKGHLNRFIKENFLMTKYRKANFIKDIELTEYKFISSREYPCVCEKGFVFNRAGVHVEMTLYYVPNVYGETLLSLVGRDSIDIKVHRDFEYPVNN